MIKITTSACIILAASSAFSNGFAFMLGWGLITFFFECRNDFSLSLFQVGSYGGSSIFCIALNRLSFLNGSFDWWDCGDYFHNILDTRLRITRFSFGFVVSDIFFFTIPSLVCLGSDCWLIAEDGGKKVLLPQFLTFLSALYYHGLLICLL